VGEYMEAAGDMVGGALAIGIVGGAIGGMLALI